METQELKTEKETTENIVIVGDKVTVVKTEEQEFNVSEMLAQKEKQLEDWIRDVKLYNESADDITTNLKNDIKKLKGL